MTVETPAAPRVDAGRATPDVEDAEVVDPDPRPRPKGARRSLGEVVRGLREGRGAMPGFSMPLAPRPMADMPVPDGARFEPRSYACAAGSRDYRLYVPASAAGGVRGLIVMLHGCTQSPEDFAAGTGMNALAEKHRLIVAYPGQTHNHNPNACWNWFRPEDQAHGAGEPAIIAGLTAALVAEFDVPRDRVFVAGLSAGGAMAAVMGEAYPDLYAGVGVHSGIAPGAARDVQSAFAAMRGAPATGVRRANSSTNAPRIIVFHGSADATVHPSNAAQVYARSGRSVPDPAAREARVGGTGTRRATRAVSRGANGALRRRVLADRGRGSRLVRRQSGRKLHRSVRPRCFRRDGPLLPRGLK